VFAMIIYFNSRVSAPVVAVPQLDVFHELAKHSIASRALRPLPLVAPIWPVRRVRGEVGLLAPAGR